ncbi:nucleotidyltransferase [Nanobdella aerobiophila]|uniref:Nucleotidyltransferase n=1 Tax=Nanobdella aerobiophila TaxID=2586965 RepID=A0A915SZH1_9ARCH|nr:nucleotidyltransferase domain-containing protein [Nanobdella aerobiophila]BBL45244.1 nucleotidyltransferase [Nanobdella aerobiophila]
MNDLEIIKKVIYDVANEYNIKIDKIILFGSRARGDYREDSDYDIAIIVYSIIDLKEFISKVHREIVRKIMKPIDIIILEKKYFDKYKNTYGDIAGILNLEGKIL